MLFNSFVFIYLFFPLTLCLYFYLNNKRKTIASRAILVFASLFFYSFWNPIYLPIILASMVFNFLLGSRLSQITLNNIYISKFILGFGIIVNLALLSFFKYFDFFIINFNNIFSTHFDTLGLLLPLAISFFTFQQIAYLVDSFRKEIVDHSFLNYALFVTFFPQLIAGPIVHHKEMMPQFASIRGKVVNWKNIYCGVFIFTIGLLKKVLIADTFSPWVAAGFDGPHVLGMFEAWISIFSYTIQIYFDFSGYSDMAIGIALAFNIKLPLNFNSPYRASSIQEFWRGWHMTLSRWLRDYVYVVLGGNRKTPFLTYRNLFLTFVIGGIWHGAGWTFVVWGAMHGLGCIVHKLWQIRGFKVPSLFGWLMTFFFVNIAWVFFRAKDLNSAINILKGAFGLNGWRGFTALDVVDNSSYIALPYLDGTVVYEIVLWIIFSFLIIFKGRSVYDMCLALKPNWCWTIFILLGLFLGILSISKESEFLYFQF